MTEDNRRMVRFVQNCSPYLANERAAFPALAAKSLVNRKVAIYDDGNTETSEKEVQTDGHDESNDGNTGSAERKAARDGERKKGKGKKNKAGKRERVKATD